MASVNTFGQVLRRIGLEEVEAEKFDKVRLPFELRQNQVDNIHCGLSYDRFGLFDDPRTGKTICMQLLTVYFAKYGLRSIVLMPPILFDQYKSTMEDIKGHGCSVVTFDYSPAKREDHLVAWQSGQGESPRAPWQWIAVARLCALGMTTAAAWGTPVCEAFCLLAASDVYEGDRSLMTEKERAIVEAVA